MATKKCTKCGKELPLEEFSKNQKTVDGLQSICKSCKRKRAIIIIAILCVLGIVAYAYFSRPVKSFEGTEETTVEENQFVFDISQAVALNSSIKVNGTADNIESFQTLYSKAVESAKQGTKQQIVIPSIGILFEKNSSELIDENLIKEFASAYLQTNKNANVLVEGYACDLGTNAHNMKLSQRRAETVKNCLLASGIASEKITVKFYGEELYGKLGLNSREEHRRVNVSIE